MITAKMIEKRMKKNSVIAKYYFPERLITQLDIIPNHTMTVVEAPSGFGKTTAVREYLAAQGRALGKVQWYTCLGESPAKAWSGICALFASLGGTLSEDLLELGAPRPENLSRIIDLLKSCHCPKSTCFVIDNYQLFEHAAPRKFLSALSRCRIENLCIIVITQPLRDEPEGADGMTAGGKAHQLHHRINTQDFFFDQASIIHYCDLRGIVITPEDAGHIQVASGGWIAAICLQLKHYAETGQIMETMGIGSLVETAVWNKLSASEKNLMISLSLLDGFTARQADIMSNGAALPSSITTLLSLEFFMRYVADKQVYSVHSILRDYLLKRFQLLPLDTMSIMQRQAACACLAVGDYYQAAVFFMHVGDYEAVLSLPFTTQYFYNNKGRGLIPFFERLVDVCPQETLQKYPVVLVLVAYLFFRDGSPAYFLKLTELLRHVLEHENALPQDQLARARAEFYMLMSFTEYNHIIKMSEWHRKAYDSLRMLSDQPRSMVFQGSMPWAVGVASYIGVYWNASGNLRQELDAMDDCLPIYSELASGHGAGAEHVFRAEAYLACGQDAEAEALCHKAMERARNAGQAGVCLCAQVVQAEIAILRGKATAYAAIRAAITQTAEASGQRSVMRMGELCLAVLDLNLGITATAPPWLCTMEGIRNTLYAHAVPYGLMIHGHWLLHEGRNAALSGLAGHLADLSRRTNLARNMNYVLLQVYRSIYLAVAESRMGREEEALAYVKNALRIALPDRMYLPFAKFAAELTPLLQELAGQGSLEFHDELVLLLAFSGRYAKGARAIGKRRQEKSSLMTAREKDVARLARDRLSVEEIASALQVSPNTVKTLLKNVYRKLGVKGKVGLRNKTW